jgi:hypothetical protein
MRHVGCASSSSSSLTLLLGLALALARTLPTTPLLHRRVEKTKIRDRDAGEKVSSLPGWRRTNTGRTQAKTGGESNISLARTSISLK